LTARESAGRNRKAWLTPALSARREHGPAWPQGGGFLDEKTNVLEEAAAIRRKEAIQQRIVDTVTVIARATMQTYVGQVKAKNASGKLTKEATAEAFQRTLDKPLDLLKREGIEVGQDVLGVVVEAVVGKLKVEESVRGEEKAGVASFVPELVEKPGALLGPDRKQGHRRHRGQARSVARLRGCWTPRPTTASRRSGPSTPSPRRSAAASRSPRTFIQGPLYKVRAPSGAGRLRHPGTTRAFSGGEDQGQEGGCG